MARRFPGAAADGYLTSASGQARGLVWSAAGWVKLPESVGQDATWNAIAIASSGSTPYGPSGIRVIKVGGRWVFGALHDRATADGYINGIEFPVVDFNGWVFVAASHVSDSLPPRLYVGSIAHPIAEVAPSAGNYSPGSGATITATSTYYLGGYGANNTFGGSVAWAAWWTGEELTPGELDTYRYETLCGRWPNIRRTALFGLWPLAETAGTATGRDLTAAHNLTATNMAAGNVSDGVALSPNDDMWWQVPSMTSGSATTVTPAAVSASVTVQAPTVSAPASARDLDGTDDQFGVTGAVAVTGDWTWAGHVTLDAGGGYLWRTQTSGGAACQTVSARTIDGRVRLEATQGRATTGAVCQWELPIPLGKDVTLAVQYESSTGRFRAWAGLPDVPMTELAWRYSQTLGSGSSTGSGTDWYVSPSSGRVNGSISWVIFAPNITATQADLDEVRRYDTSYAWLGTGGWWKFDEQSGNAADSSGNGRTLTASGSPGVRARTAAPTAESSTALTLTSIPDCRIFQRQYPLDDAALPIAGAASGTPSAIEARFTPFGSTPGSWTTIDAAPAGGGAAYSGSLTVGVGQGVLEVRANQGGGSYSYVRRFGVGVGDIYLAVGTSNASGVETGDGYTRVATVLTDYEFGKPFPVQMSNRKVADGVHEWHEIHDPVDAYSAASTDLPSRTNSIYGPSATWTQGTYTPTDTTIDTNTTGAGKSVWPAVAALILEHHSLPVAIVPCPRGGSNVASWNQNVATYWSDMRARVEELAGVSVSDTTTLDGTMALAVLAVHGENDYGANPATYEANSSTNGSIRDWCVNDVGANMGLPTFLMVTGDWPGTSAYNYTNAPQDGITRVRAANQAAWDEFVVYPGPVTYDLDLADSGGDGFHYRTQTELDTLAKRWYAAIDVVYSGAAGDGRGPQIVSCTRAGTAVTIKFDVSIDASSTLDGISVYDGTPAPGTRLDYTTDYTAARGADTTTAVITLAALPAGTVYVGIGEFDLSAGKGVPSVTRTVGGVSVTLPAEVASQVTALPFPAPSTVTAAAAVQTPAVVASPAVAAVAVTASTQSPTVTASASVPAAATVTATVAVLAPTIVAGSGITITPATVTATSTVPAATATTAATATPAAVTATTTVAAPAIGAASSVTVPVAAVAATAAVPAAAIGASTLTAPAAVAATAAVLAPTVTVIGQQTTVLPAAVAATATARTIAVTATATVQADGPIGALSWVPAPAPTSAYRNISIVPQRRRPRWRRRGSS